MTNNLNSHLPFLLLEMFSPWYTPTSPYLSHPSLLILSKMPIPPLNFYKTLLGPALCIQTMSLDQGLGKPTTPGPILACDLFL